MTTVCTQCEHLKNLEPETVREHVWYNHLCRAEALPIVVDPYDGQEKSIGVEDFAYCRDKNDDNCADYKAR